MYPFFLRQQLTLRIDIVHIVMAKAVQYVQMQLYYILHRSRSFQYAQKLGFRIGICHCIMLKSCCKDNAHSFPLHKVYNTIHSAGQSGNCKLSCQKHYEQYFKCTTYRLPVVACALSCCYIYIHVSHIEQRDRHSHSLVGRTTVQRS